MAYAFVLLASTGNAHTHTCALQKNFIRLTLIQTNVYQTVTDCKSPDKDVSMRPFRFPTKNYTQRET